jgi:superfamily I DNA/RNA helicase
VHAGEQLLRLSGSPPALYQGAVPVRPADPGRPHAVHVWSVPDQFKETALVVELVRRALEEVDSASDIAVLYRAHMLVGPGGGGGGLVWGGGDLPGSPLILTPITIPPPHLNPQGNHLEKKLREAGIPIVRFGRQSFWDTKEICTALALLRLAAAPHVSGGRVLGRRGPQSKALRRPPRKAAAGLPRY